MTNHKMSSCAWCSGCARDEAEVDVVTEVIVHMNNREANAKFKYPDNFVKTSHYSAVSFLPLGLLVQFRKVSNFYFLINMCFALIPGVSPMAPATAVLPLVFVVGVALVKEGVEEYHRHVADRRANSIEVEAIVDGKLCRVESRKLCPGDIVRVHNGEEVRADLLCLSTSNGDGQAFIDMCNLDGEVSLKTRKVLECTSNLKTVEDLKTAQLTIHTESPDPALLTWNGRVEYGGQDHAVDIDNFLCRGSIVHRTDWLWGVIVYAGKDTKMLRNLKKRPPKASDLDKKLNVMIFLVFLLQNVFLIMLSSLAVKWSKEHENHWYISWYTKQYTGVMLWLRSYVTYFILLSFLIPISLFVTIEACKVIQAYWMHRDSDMMELVNGVLRNCRPNTSNLNEQLAMVRYIFTDKTGTLTENVMNFKRGDIRGHVVTDDDWKKSAELLNPNHPCRDAAVEYFLALSLCHTVQPVTDSNTSEIVYEGSSPDELALVKTAARHGFRLIDRTSKTITVDEEGLICVYDILATLEFTSERKMMSIVVRRQSGDEIILYTKGADGSIFAQASENSTVQNYALRLKGTLAEMGDYGLRTLLVARRSITQCEFTEWQSQFAQASKLITNRTSAVDKVCLELERKLWLLGATAIEDKLQDKVPETISFFLNAGVVIWMLTGDKRETAVTIGATASLCDPRKDYIVHIDIGSLSPRDPAAAEKVAADIRQVELAVARARETNSHCSFVIDGLALGVAMEKYFDTFLRVSQCVNSAICCRLTPLQKANIVRMFQKSTGHTAIAIGDGANDVSMIQEGRVGVGIIGLEGSQAALSADYAIPRFKNLRRLCAVHGRYSVVRNASCIVVSFYKNATLSIIQILFSIYCGFSGETLFDGWLLTFFNIILTSLPPFLMGIFDEDLPEGVLERSPKLFAPLSRGLYFNMFVVVRWLFEATFHGVALFYVVFPTLKQRDWNRDHNASGSMIGTVELIILVCVVFARIALQIKCWRVVHILGLLLSMVVTITLLLVYSALLHVGDSSIYWQMYLVVVSPKFWLYLVLSVGTLIVVIDLSILHFQKHFWPTMRDLAENEELRMLATVRKNGPTGNVAAAKVDDSSLL